MEEYFGVELGFEGSMFMKSIFYWGAFSWVKVTISLSKP